MTNHRMSVAAAAAVVVAGCVLAYAQGPSQLPLAPMKTTGVAISPAQEGWWRNPDGTVTFLVGYYNRNSAALEVPIGPNNRIEPDGPDMGQPTHFLPGRQRGTFSITVPKDFGNKKLTWTLTANGQTQSITLWLNQPYVLDPYRNASNGNTPPKVRFEPNGPELTATPSGVARTIDAAPLTPVSLTLWATDLGNTIVLNPFAEADGQAAAAGAGRGAAAGRGRGGESAPLRVTWSKSRGPGEVKFDPVSPAVEADGKTASTAMFSTPGEYIVRAQINDASGDGGGGDGCCWTNVHVRVNVK